MKYRKREGKIPASHMHHEIPTRDVPPNLSTSVDVTLWNQHGDHPAVQKVENIWHADGTVVAVTNGMVELFKGKPPVTAESLKQNGVVPAEGTRFFQLEEVHGIVRDEDENGHFRDHIVKPGYAIVENKSDGKVWAISPHHLKAWFEQDNE